MNVSTKLKKHQTTICSTENNVASPLQKSVAYMYMYVMFKTR